MTNDLREAIECVRRAIESGFTRAVMQGDVDGDTLEIILDAASLALEGSAP
jgi:hypothetical protein